MPGPWKRAAAVSRFISGLRSRHPSNLVVETGFPTSLADLVVKNRARLAKPRKGAKTKKIKKPIADTAAIPAPVPTPTPPPPAVAGGPPRAAAPAPAARRSRLIDLLAAKLLVLAFLLIGRKGVVSGITITSFALLILDLLGLRVFELLKPCSEARRSLNSVVDELDLAGREWASPIREEDADADADAGRDVSAERWDLGVVATVAADSNVGSVANLADSRTKKLWKRLVPKKFRKRSVRKDGAEVDSGSSRGGASDFSDESILFSDEREEQRRDVEVPSSVASGEISRVDDDVFRENASEAGLPSCLSLSSLALVLLGLTGGKGVAVLVTIGYYLCAKSVETLRKRLK